MCAPVWVRPCLQVLPPHILTGLRGGTRVLVEKFPDVALLCADVVGFSTLAATADTPDCILMLNRCGQRAVGRARVGVDAGTHARSGL